MRFVLPLALFGLLAAPTASAQSHLADGPGVYLALRDLQAGTFRASGSYTYADKGDWPFNRDVGLGGQVASVTAAYGASLSAGYRFGNGLDLGLRVDAATYDQGLGGRGGFEMLLFGPRFGYTAGFGRGLGIRADAELLYGVIGGSVAASGPGSAATGTSAVEPGGTVIQSETFGATIEPPVVYRGTSQRLFPEGSVSLFQQVRLASGLTARPAAGVYYRLNVDHTRARLVQEAPRVPPSADPFEGTLGTSGTQEDHGLQFALPLSVRTGGQVVTFAPTFRYSLNGDGRAGGHAYGGAGLSVSF
jgi:hypothetical protein